jgi:hypothetical protein
MRCILLSFRLVKASVCQKSFGESGLTSLNSHMCEVAHIHLLLLVPKMWAVSYVVRTVDKRTEGTSTMTVSYAGGSRPAGVVYPQHGTSTGMTRSPHDAPPGQTSMTLTQVRTFNELLAVGGPRPVMPPTLFTDLESKVATAVAPVLARWTEPRMWLTKSQLFTALRCEGQLKADNGPARKARLHPATVVGIIAHRAIQIAHTHPDHPVSEYVQYALLSSLKDEDIAEFWGSADLGTQSDLQMQMTSRVTSFLDSWPVLDPRWTPRFEEPIQAKVGGVTLSARADLTLGRPRPNGVQTMVLCDLKSGALRDEEHFDEAMFYALVSTLRHGVAPFRSTVFSLASGTYTDADVTPERLHNAADKVVEAVTRIVDVKTEFRAPDLVAGLYCGWCPAKATCPAFAAYDPDTTKITVPRPRAASTTDVAGPSSDSVETTAAGSPALLEDIDPFDVTDQL